MKVPDVKAAVESALDQLIKRDEHLLLNDVNERSISHRLAIYLEAYFPEWDIDCEYNRNHDDPKRLDIARRKVTSDDIQATTVYPDIIVHRRGTNTNLLVIEMKKTSSSECDSYDLGKLQAFKEQLGYKYAVFIKLSTAGNAGLEDKKWL